ncbi:MAG: hypothetical protein QGF53_02745 [Alphaproteobacteria bacterium]|jgi:hypothetical protein|nr:hypothetical protein [Alphaproteobacteria bacterium]
MFHSVRELAARRPDRGPDGLTANEVQALMARGRRLRAQAFNDVIDGVAARVRRWVR